MDEVSYYHSYVVRDPRNGQVINTANPALIAYSLIGRRMEEAGFKIDTESFIEAADYCENAGLVVAEFAVTGDLQVDLASVCPQPLKIVFEDGVISAQFFKDGKKRGRTKLT